MMWLSVRLLHSLQELVTYWGLNEMTNILQVEFQNWDIPDSFSQISIGCGCKGLVEDEWALIQVMFGTERVTPDLLNPLAPGKFEWNFGFLIFEIISVIDGWGISRELARR